ncbi:hypothetical protein LA080_010100 [Diaporthe eres]|nr:hypothetical protein LA080_010100 [Diaporthe eres]
MVFTKISLLIFYLRIFEPFMWARTAIWTSLITILIFYTTCDAVILGACFSPSGQIRMDTTIAGEGFQADVKTALVAAWFGTIIDFYILAIPVVLISGLMLNRQRKICVLAIFMTGLFACAASAANLAQRYKLNYTDITYNDNLFYLYVAKISGLRNLIQRFQRNTSREASVVVNMSDIPTLGSFNEEYHHQVKEIHNTSSAKLPGLVAPGSHRQDVYARSNESSCTGEPAPISTFEEVRFPQFHFTFFFVVTTSPNSPIAIDSSVHPKNIDGSKSSINASTISVKSKRSISPGDVPGSVLLHPERTDGAGKNNAMALYGSAVERLTGIIDVVIKPNGEDPGGALTNRQASGAP